VREEKNKDELLLKQADYSSTVSVAV